MEFLRGWGISIAVFAPVVINEALSRTDVRPPTDSIELHNPTAQTANIGGWWLSDDFNFPQKFRFTNGTVIPAGGYLVLNESHFNTGFTPFALSSDGDEVWLFSGDGSGNLTLDIDWYADTAASGAVVWPAAVPGPRLSGSACWRRWVRRSRRSATTARAWR